MSDVKIIVTKAFPGCADGNPVVRTFEEGEEISGELARVALQEKWAKKVSAGKSDKEGAKKDSGASDDKSKAAKKDADLKPSDDEKPGEKPDEEPAA